MRVGHGVSFGEAIAQQSSSAGKHPFADDGQADMYWRLVLEAADVRSPEPIAYSPDGSQFVTGGPQVQVRSAATGEIDWSFPNFKRHGPGFGHVLFSPDGNHVAAIEDYSILKIFDRKTGRRLVRTELTDDRISAMTWSPDSRLLATSQLRGVVTVWEVARLLDSGVNRARGK